MFHACWRQNQVSGLLQSNTSVNIAAQVMLAGLRSRTRAVVLCLTPGSQESQESVRAERYTGVCLVVPIISSAP
jgi:hypothetical protein